MESANVWRPEGVQLSTTPSEFTNLEVKSQQTESGVHLPGQVELNILEESAENALPMNDRKTEQKIIFEKCMTFFRFFGLLNGISVSFTWKPKRSILIFYSLINIIYCLLSIFYTVYRHCVEGNYVKALEPLAVSGVTLSVKQNF